MVKHKNSLPTKTDLENPKLEIEGFTWAVHWEDEGLPHPSYYLTRSLLYVIHYRSRLILGNKGKMSGYGPKYFDKIMFKLAKFHFPNWIGFNPNRCSFDPELADRILRMQKVSEWRLNKMFDEN